jgi:hypothetical protein
VPADEESLCTVALVRLWGVVVGARTGPAAIGRALREGVGAGRWATVFAASFSGDLATDFSARGGS